VIERDDGIERELAVVHPLGEDDVIVPVRRLGADPGHVGPLARVDLGPSLEEHGLSALEFLRLRQRFEQDVEVTGLLFGQGKAEWAYWAVGGNGHMSAP